MRFELEFERVYPHPPAAVWRAITEREALAEWLMDNDFAPRPGREFHLHCPDEDDPHRIRCRVLEIEPGRRMVWSWTRQDGSQAVTAQVEFILEPLPEGTRLRVRHRGEAAPGQKRKYEGGWPGNLERLARATDQRDST